MYGVLLAFTLAQNPGAFTPNGPVHDGKTVTCDLPEALRHRNTSGTNGQGLCVFWSITHSARYQNELALWDFAVKMQREPGGGYPQKVDAMIKKYGPGVIYAQHTGGDEEFLRLALKTGRPLGVTYNGRDDFYRGTIAHMVNLVYLDESAACILDNNRPNVYVWMTRAEFLSRWRGASGWAVVLLASPPAPKVVLP